MEIRQPIITFMGHIDHGKTSLQDYIRQSALVKAEAGSITQHIGSSDIPLDTIKKICGKLLDALKLEFTIPGLLFIDTPGHAAFTNLRRRGGNLADIVILVVDINEGIMPQTLECVEILNQYKTPFIIALNKIDLLSGWQKKDSFLIQNISSQAESIQQILDTKLYEIVGKLSELGFNAERFDRVEDHTKQIAIVPTSAATGEGMPELLMVLTGLAQKFMEQNLKIDTKGNAKGTVLEIKEEKGLGKTLDVIVYDGSLNQSDVIVIGTLSEPIVTKVKALLEPSPLADIRDKKTKFQHVKEVSAAAGVKIFAPELENAVAGMPLRSCLANEAQKVKEEVKKEVEEVIIETDKQGIVVKADSLGSLEALIKLLKEKNIDVKRGSIGNISKKDISEAQISREKDYLHSVVLGFNVSLMSDVKALNVKVITNNVIYKLIEDFEKWQEEERKKIEGKEIEFLVRPCKMQIMKGYIFRQSNPAVAGMDILAGNLKVNTPLMKKNGITITEAKSIQHEQENIEKAEKGKQVAVSMPKVMVGRQINEGDILYSAIPEDDFKKLKELKKYLAPEEIEILKEIAGIMREKNPVWGV
ncbi:MAG: translation initiation factor IF-2 [Candidatus Woesearchaeota archaeon]|jgi:translation initiation factor 5B|nr:translation initiation factor IF-2 [Candidatus Woesearchaeota archaeon]MDP7622627.1 translation initiation factor IF-2 [Candidatus Woesearchaeota archaeon]HJN57339.1 translation initiation factor IF-2 [Candidatus Woesearchaeota archaeon]|tara:strand:- start:22040 stop:23800 length:1761 start_codon:yes stop_codon:yes gene_type:complete